MVHAAGLKQWLTDSRGMAIAGMRRFVIEVAAAVLAVHFAAMCGAMCDAAVLALAAPHITPQQV
jgi:hypothetical protein